MYRGSETFLRSNEHFSLSFCSSLSDLLEERDVQAKSLELKRRSSHIEHSKLRRNILIKSHT